MKALLLVLGLALGVQAHANEFIHVNGVNGDIDTSAEDMASQGGDLHIPSAAAATNVISSDANDDGSPAGTGARTVRVEGLNSSGLPIVEDVVLNGTTQVALTNQFFRVNKFYVLTAGSGAANAGAITVRHTTNVISSIAIGDNIARQAMYTVPLGKRARIVKANAKITNAPTGSVTALVQTRKSGGAWLPRLSLYANDTVSLQDSSEQIISLEPLEDVRLRASSSANNTAATGSIQIETTLGQF